MAGLGKEVKWLNACDSVVAFRERANITSLGGGIAGHVDDSPWLEFDELIEEGGFAAFSRRIDDDAGGLGIGTKLLEDCFRRSH